jgi:hypothetical protein
VNLWSCEVGSEKLVFVGSESVVVDCLMLGDGDMVLTSGVVCDEMVLGLVVTYEQIRLDVKGLFFSWTKG